MSFLKAKLESSQGIPVHMPANGEEIAIERAGGGGFVGGGGGGRARQRVVGAVASASVAAAVVGKKMKTKLEATSLPAPLDNALDHVAAAAEAVDAGWRPSPAHSALVELVLRPRRGGGFGVGLYADDGGDESGSGSGSGGEEEGSGDDEEMEDAQQQQPKAR